MSDKPEEKKETITQDTEITVDEYLALERDVLLGKSDTMPNGRSVKSIREHNQKQADEQQAKLEERRKEIFEKGKEKVTMKVTETGVTVMNVVKEKPAPPLELGSNTPPQANGADGSKVASGEPAKAAETGKEAAKVITETKTPSAPASAAENKAGTTGTGGKPTT